MISNPTTVGIPLRGAPRRRDAVAPEPTDQGHVLRTARRKLLLNDTAVALWHLCDGETTPAEMVASICQLFDAAPDSVEADVLATLAELTAAGAIDWADEAGEAQ